MLFVPTFLGDFEAWFWYVKDFNNLLPPRLAFDSSLYFNRQNGLIIGTQEAYYVPSPTNWTTFGTDSRDQGNVFDLNIPTQNSTKSNSTSRVVQAQAMTVEGGLSTLIEALGNNAAASFHNII